MNQRLKQLLIGLLVVGSAEGLYGIIQHSVKSSYSFLTPYDDMIPLVHGWIWIYISIFPSFILAAIFLEKESFNLTLKRVIWAQIITFPFFIFIPADYPRPHIVDDGTFYGWGYALMHQLDGANNTFPSLHVSMTWAIMHELMIVPAYSLTVFTYSMLVTWSVLFTKQHFIWDAVGGIMVYLAIIFGPKLIAQIRNFFQRS